jgi:hypothetical protein
MIDPNKKYTTRDGREVVIYAVYADQEYPVHGAIKENEFWNPEVWECDGFYGIMPYSDADLIEVQEMTVIDALLYINRHVAKTSMSDEQAVLMDKCFTILHSLVGENPYYTVKK